MPNNFSSVTTGHVALGHRPTTHLASSLLTELDHWTDPTDVRPGPVQELRSRSMHLTACSLPFPSVFFPLTAYAVCFAASVINVVISGGLFLSRFVTQPTTNKLMSLQLRVTMTHSELLNEAKSSMPRPRKRPQVCVGTLYAVVLTFEFSSRVGRCRSK